MVRPDGPLDVDVNKRNNVFNNTSGINRQLINRN